MLVDEVVKVVHSIGPASYEGFNLDGVIGVGEVKRHAAPLVEVSVRAGCVAWSEYSAWSAASAVVGPGMWSSPRPAVGLGGVCAERALSLEDARVAYERVRKQDQSGAKITTFSESPKQRAARSHAHRERHAYDADVTVACASKRQHARADATVRAGGGPRRSTQERGSLGSEIKIWDAVPQLIPLRLHRPGMPSQILRSPRQYVAAMLRALLSFLARGENTVKYVPNFAEDRWSVVRDFVVGAVAEAATSIAQPAERLIVVAAPFADWVINVNGYRRRPPSCSTPSSSGDTSPGPTSPGRTPRVARTGRP